MQGVPLLEQEGWLRQSIKWREATELGADGVVPLERPATNSFGTTPPARPFLEFDGLAGTPPDSGGEFQTRNCQLVLTPLRRWNAQIAIQCYPLLPGNLDLLWLQLFLLRKDDLQDAIFIVG